MCVELLVMYTVGVGRAGVLITMHVHLIDAINGAIDTYAVDVINRGITLSGAKAKGLQSNGREHLYRGCITTVLPNAKHRQARGISESPNHQLPIIVTI